MITTLAPRIFALPADVRFALARVDGPGWAMCRIVGVPVVSVRTAPSRTSDRYGEAFWSANPAASVAAVTGWPVGKAHELLHDAWCRGESDDHAAALSIVEAHVADRSANV